MSTSIKVDLAAAAEAVDLLQQVDQFEPRWPSVDDASDEPIIAAIADLQRTVQEVVDQTHLMVTALIRQGRSALHAYQAADAALSRALEIASDAPGSGSSSTRTGA